MSTVATPPSSAGRDVVRLTSATPLVPAELLEPPWRGDSRGTLRDLAALLLDRHLRRLARIRQPVDLRLAVLLHRLDSGSGYLALGFARMTDYTTERLGLPSRRVQTLLALARRLGDLPQIATAFEAGHVSLSQVQLLLRVVTPGTEADWLARATATTVRRLEAEVRAAEAAALAETAAAAGAATRAAAAPSAEAGTADGQERPEGCERPEGPQEGAHTAVDDDPSAAGEFIGFTAPVRLRARWEQALELARRSSGASDPAWRSVEFIAAEYLSGVPDIAFALARAIAERGGSPAGDEAPDFAGDGNSSSCGAGDDGGSCERPGDDGAELYEEVLAALAADALPGSPDAGAGGAVHGPRFPDDRPRVVLPDSVGDDPADSVREWDAKLLELVHLRQSVSWNLGRLLRIFADRRLHRELGFLTFSRFCRERVGLGVRRAWQLIALERRLVVLPALTRAYRSGALSWVKASAIARVATDRTENQWLRLAGAVSVRRLNDEVALAHLGFAPSGPPGLDPEGRVQLSSPLRPASAATPLDRRPGDGSPGSPPPVARPRVTAPDSGIAGGSTGPVASRPDLDPLTRIRFWAPHSVASLWHESLALARHLAPHPLSDAECVEAMLDAFFSTWAVRADPAWHRRYRIFERDGWRCRVPGCTSRRNLQVHHVIFRSHGGSDDDRNLVVLCATHHLQGIHRDRLRCHALPEGLLAWEFDPDPERGPLVAYVEDVLWSAARAAVAAAPATAAAAPASAEPAPVFQAQS